MEGRKHYHKCGKKSVKRVDYSKDKKTLKDPADYACTECDYSNKNIVTVRKHYHKVHNILRPGTLVCEKCSKVCYSKVWLEIHEKECPSKNQNPKPLVVCEDCGKVFKHRKALVIHKHSAHQDISTRTCGVCDKVFSNRADTYKHYLTDHPNEACPIEVDNVHVCKCQICSKILASSSALYTHYKLSHKIAKETMFLYFTGFKISKQESNN